LILIELIQDLSEFTAINKISTMRHFLMSLLKQELENAGHHDLKKYPIFNLNLTTYNDGEIRNFEDQAAAIAKIAIDDPHAVRLAFERIRDESFRNIEHLDLPT